MVVILVADIEFENADKKTVKIPKGTEIYLDAVNNIGLYKGYHFHIENHEYACFN